MGKRASLAQFFRRTELLHKKRRVDTSINADKQAQRQVTETHSDLSTEVERALTNHAHKELRSQLDKANEYNVKVLQHSCGTPTVFAVKSKSKPAQAHGTLPSATRTPQSECGVRATPAGPSSRRTKSVG